MSNDVTNWFDGFAKAAEASGITDPAEIQKLLVFQKRAELAAKYPSKFEEGFTSVVKKAQAQDTSLYQNSGAPGFTSEDITPDVGHHMLNNGLGGAAIGGMAGGLLRKLTGGLGTAAPRLPVSGLGPMGESAGRFITSLGRNPHGGNIGILGALIGAMYGASKGHFMTGRYGEGSQVGTNPETYLNQMEPQVNRMKSIRQRLAGALGPERGHMSSTDWYAATHPQ